MKNNWICGSQSDIFSNLISVLFSELTRISLPGQKGNPLSLKQNGKRMACYDFMITCNKKELWQAHDNSYKVNWSKMNDRMISWPIMIMIIMKNKIHERLPGPYHRMGEPASLCEPGVFLKSSQLWSLDCLIRGRERDLYDLYSNFGNAKKNGCFFHRIHLYVSVQIAVWAVLNLLELVFAHLGIELNIVENWSQSNLDSIYYLVWFIL